MNPTSVDAETGQHAAGPAPETFGARASASQHDTLRIISFNINGLRACLRRLYGPTATVKKLLDDVGRDAGILCFQETKLRKSELLSAPELATAEGWDAFFSCADSTRGYSGVATFVRTAKCLPFDAKIGFSGLAPPVSTASNSSSNDGGDAKHVHPDLLAYFATEELRNLDSEGRVVVTDHRAFVLFNVYGPALTSEDPIQAAARMAFKVRFFAALERRWRALLAAGRHVIVVGDLNIAPSQIDYPDFDPDFFRSTRPDRLWLRSLLQASPTTATDTERSTAISFVDCFRAFHPDARSAFTCWSTATNARVTNYGSRIDLCLAAGFHAGPSARTEALAAGRTSWVAASDIWPEQQGSDHCPVWVDVGFVGEFPCGAVPPLTAMRFAFAEGGKQTKLHAWLTSRRGNGTQAVDLERRDTGRDDSFGGYERQQKEEGTPSLVPANGMTKSHGTMGLTAAAPSVSYGRQASLKAFLKATNNASSGGTTTTTTTTTTTAITTTTLTATATQLAATSAVHASAAAMPDQQQTPSFGHHPTFGGQLKLQEELEAAAQARAQDLAQAKNAWGAIQKKMTVPRCRHNEPAALKQVGKSGPNKGRWFYTCARPEGKGSEAQCGYFKWVEKRPGDAGSGLQQQTQHQARQQRKNNDKRGPNSGDANFKRIKMK